MLESNERPRTRQEVLTLIANDKLRRGYEELWYLNRQIMQLNERFPVNLDGESWSTMVCTLGSVALELRAGELVAAYTPEVEGLIENMGWPNVYIGSLVEIKRRRHQYWQHEIDRVLTGHRITAMATPSNLRGIGVGNDQGATYWSVRIGGVTADYYGVDVAQGALYVGQRELLFRIPVYADGNSAQQLAQIEVDAEPPAINIDL